MDFDSFLMDFNYLAIYFIIIPPLPGKPPLSGTPLSGTQDPYMEVAMLSWSQFCIDFFVVFGPPWILKK